VIATSCGLKLCREFQGVSIGLPERLWALAGEQQKERLEGDEWFELIARYVAGQARCQHFGSIMR